MAQPAESKKPSESAWRIGCVVGFIATALLYAHLNDTELWKWWVPAAGIVVGQFIAQLWDGSDGPRWVMVASALALVVSALLLSVYFVALAAFVVIASFLAMNVSLRRFRRAHHGSLDRHGIVSFEDRESGRTTNSVAAGVVSAWAEKSASVVGYRDDGGGPRYRVLAGAPAVLMERRLRAFAQWALVFTVIVTASSIFLNEVSKRDAQVTHNAAPESSTASQ